MNIFLGMADEVKPLDVDSLTEAEAVRVCLILRRFWLAYLDQFPASMLSLSVRAENGLIRQKIKTLGDVLRRLDESRPWPGVGKKSLNEYRSELGRLTQ